MKGTIMMIAFIATTILTWLFIAAICWVTTDLTYKESISNGNIGMIMLFIGWGPAIVVCNDLDKKLES
jgi:hypothetical protein